MLFLVLLSVAFIGFIALGVWQLQRMAWKHELIARVDARVHAEPVDIPDAGRWAALDAASDEYRRVRLSGTWLEVPAIRVQAVTELGPGWWLLAPLETDRGEIVLVNRGYLPTGTDAAAAVARGPATVTGLLRISEPDGGFLRDNAPAEDRWHSRDVAAIAQARKLDAARVAPFFVDADRSASRATTAGDPVGGLTVVRFRDNHLQYALTWFAMAALTALAAARLFVIDGRLRQHRRRPRHERRDAAPVPGR